MNNQPEPLKKIKSLLRLHRNGLTITDIAEKLRLNRNSAAKYLEILLISGDVKLNTFGPAKVYTFSQKMPVSAMMKFSADMMLLIDHDLHVLDANENALNILEISREDLIGNSVMDIVSPIITRLDIPSVFDEIQTKGEIQRDFCITLKNEDLHYRMRLIPTVFDNMDEGLTVIGEDITERIRFEERLLVSEARFRAIVEDQTDFICRYKPDGTITFINDPMSRYFGVSLQEICGRNLFSRILPEDHILAREMLSQVAKNREARTGDIRILDKEGHYRWYQWNTRGICDSKGVLIECQSVGRDINTEREQEQKIRENEERFRLISDYSPFPILITDEEGRNLYVNNAFTRLFGYSLTDIPTEEDWFRRAFPHTSDRQEIMQSWRSDPLQSPPHTMDTVTVPISGKDGFIRQVSIFQITLQNGEKFVVYEDLTPKKEAERLHTVLATIVNSSDDAPSLYRSLNNVYSPH